MDNPVLIPSALLEELINFIAKKHTYVEVNDLISRVNSSVRLANILDEPAKKAVDQEPVQK